jgi:hypothetical protein
MRKLMVGLFVVLGTSTVAMAGGWAPYGCPEIDPTTGMAALAFLVGAVLVIRGRRTE